MNQEKIGKFIAELRKENNLTQEERGLGLMDISLLKFLSKILNVSVTELLNGEKINENDAAIKSEEALVKTIEYTKKKQKRVKLLTLILGIIICLLLCSLEAILYVNNIDEKTAYLVFGIFFIFAIIGDILIWIKTK